MREELSESFRPHHHQSKLPPEILEIMGESSSDF